MTCDKCGVHIEKGEDREYAGQILCEDCYMDALSPVKTCDPWAVYSATSMRGKQGDVITKIQEEILSVLKETNGIELEPLAGKLGLTMGELQREIATLRHMEKLKASMEEGKKIFRLWE